MSATSFIPGPGTVSPLGPAIVLMPGAWADSPSRVLVIERLRAGGYPVRAIGTPLQGLVRDTACLCSYLVSTVGPVVVVGHSNGGALITNVEPSPFDTGSLLNTAEADGLTISLEWERDTGLTHVATSSREPNHVPSAGGNSGRRLLASLQVRTVN